MLSFLVFRFLLIGGNIVADLLVADFVVFIIGLVLSPKSLSYSYFGF